MKRTQLTRSHPEHRWPAGVPDIVWAPLAAGALMFLAGAIGLALGQPLLFPSLGPTAFLQTETPELRTARFYNTVVGHLLALAAGLLAVFALGAQRAPSVLASQQLTPVRLAAAVLSIVLTLLLGYLLRASHPPAAATTLLVALGGFTPTGATIRTVIVGVLIVAAAGEGLRRLRLGHGLAGGGAAKDGPDVTERAMRDRAR
jgi:hypothetical protein